MNSSETLHQTLVKYAKKNGEHVSIIEVQTDKKITYWELLSAVLSLQNFLGNKPRTIILATSGGIINSVVWLTSLIYGHFLIPISTNTTEFEYAEIVSIHSPDFLITETEKQINQTKTQQLTVSDIRSIISKYKTVSKTMPRIHDGTIYFETSGSTGKPKGMLLSASQMMTTAENISNAHELTEKDRGLTSLPFYHVNAPVVSLLTTIISGGTIIIAPKFSASRFWKWVQKYDPTWISVVPTIIAILLKSDKPAFLEKSSIRFFRTGSSPLPEVNLRRFEKKFGLPLIETYGISEGASAIFMNPLPPREHKAGSVGLPLLKVKIVNPKTRKKVTQGEAGEIQVKGKQIIDHYEQGQGNDSFENGWFKTGDLGYFDKDGYLFLTGRKKEIIIRGGENIIPREIEEVLLTYPGIVEVAVVGFPDKILGEKVVAFLVSEQKNKNEVGKILEFAKSKLSPQKIPAEMYILDTLPHGRTNKIDKNALKKIAHSD